MLARLHTRLHPFHPYHTSSLYVLTAHSSFFFSYLYLLLYFFFNFSSAAYLVPVPIFPSIVPIFSYVLYFWVHFSSVAYLLPVPCFFLAFNLFLGYLSLKLRLCFFPPHLLGAFLSGIHPPYIPGGPACGAEAGVREVRGIPGRGVRVARHHLPHDLA